MHHWCFCLDDPCCLGLLTTYSNWGQKNWYSLGLEGNILCGSNSLQQRKPYFTTLKDCIPFSCQRPITLSIYACFYCLVFNQWFITFRLSLFFSIALTAPSNSYPIPSLLISSLYFSNAWNVAPAMLSLSPTEVLTIVFALLQHIRD